MQVRALLFTSDLTSGLAPGLLFPYRWLLVGSAPLFWGFLDIAAARARLGLWDKAAMYLGYGLVWWLVTFPLIFAFTLLMARHSRRQLKPQCLDHFKSFLVSLLLSAMSIGGQFLQHLPLHTFGSISILLAGGVWMILRIQEKNFEAMHGFQGLESLGPIGYGSADEVGPARQYQVPEDSVEL